MNPRECLAAYVEQRVAVEGIFARSGTIAGHARHVVTVLFEDVRVLLDGVWTGIGHVWVRGAESIVACNPEQGSTVLCRCLVGRYAKQQADGNHIVCYGLNRPLSVSVTPPAASPVLSPTDQERAVPDWLDRFKRGRHDREFTSLLVELLLMQQRSGRPVFLLEAVLGALHFEDVDLPALPPGSDLASFWDAQAEWSRATFGSDTQRGPAGPLKHLVREALTELLAVPREHVDDILAHVPPGQPVLDLEEYVDLQFLVFDAARRAGHSFRDLVAGCHAKLEKNKRRAWPAVDPSQANEAIEHHRNEEKQHDTHGSI